MTPIGAKTSIFGGNRIHMLRFHTALELLCEMLKIINFAKDCYKQMDPADFIKCIINEHEDNLPNYSCRACV